MSTNSEVGAKYRMYFNYDNDKKVYVVPVLPEKIKVTVKGSTTSIDLEKFGEVLYKGRRDAMVISFSSFFPQSGVRIIVHVCKRSLKIRNRGTNG